MPKIPKRDYTRSMLDEPKLYAVTYTYEVNGEWFADTWNITERNNIGQAIEDVDAWCESNLESGNWSAYEITNINIIRRGE